MHHRAAIVVIVALVVAVAVWQWTSRGTHSRPGAGRSRAAPQVARSETRELGLAVTWRGPHLEVTWNPEAAAIRQAATGVLVLKRGAERTEIPLQRADLHTGRLLYIARSTSIDIRLDVTTDTGQRFTEAVYFLAGQLPPALPPKRPSVMPRVPPAPEPVVEARPAAPVPGSTNSEYQAAVPIGKATVTVSDSVRAMLETDATVEVQVRIDAAGNVIAVQTAGYDLSPLEKTLAEIARNAALQWRFTPAREAGRAVASDYMIAFKFRK